MSVSNNSNLKTSICKYAFIGCKQLHKCWYAHNKEELRQRYCINGTNCNDKNCCYLHSNKNVDKDEYYLRILLKSDILGIDKNNIKKQLEMINSKIIIELDYNDYENDDNIEIKNEIKPINSEDDDELKKYIENFTEQYKIKPEQFYNKIDDKNEITLKLKANDLQIQMLTNFMKTMNIEFNIDTLVRPNL